MAHARQNKVNFALLSLNRYICLTMSGEEGKKWYAMRATYRRELVAKKALEGASVECFVPMVYCMRIIGGRRRRSLEPAIHNLIFVRAEKGFLQDFKRNLPYLQYMTRSCDGKNVPIVIPDRQMEQFIRVSESSEARFRYLPYDPESLVSGTRICVRSGPFEGMTGYLVRSGSSGRRKVVICIDGVLSLSAVSVTLDQIEVTGPPCSGNA